MKTSTGFMRINSLLSFAAAITIIFSSTMLNGQVSYSVDFSTSMVIFDKISAEDGNTYDKVEYTTLSISDELGKPFLPVKYVKLIVPSDQDVDSIVLKHIKKEEMPGSFFVLPVQRPIPTSIDPPKYPFIKPDPEVYDSDTPYPKEIAAVSNDGFFDGFNHIITVAIYPIQYLPKSGRLTFHSSIDFEIKMKPSDNVRMYRGMRTPENQGIYDAILRKIVDNPQDIPNYQRKASLGKSESVQINPLPSYEYVIITHSCPK